MLVTEMIENGLYLVVGAENCAPHSLENVVKEAVQGGVRLIQLREKSLSTRKFLEIARALKSILAEEHVPLIINDRIDIALAIDAQGVHLGQSDMPYRFARALLGQEKIIGLSVESLDEMHEAKHLDADYIALSPIFSTPTKTDTKIQWGYEGIQTVKKFITQPLVAIGGINQTNITEVLAAGADIIALVSAISQSDDPKHSAKMLQEVIDQHTVNNHSG